MFVTDQDKSSERLKSRALYEADRPEAVVKTANKMAMCKGNSLNYSHPFIESERLFGMKIIMAAVGNGQVSDADRCFTKHHGAKSSKDHLLR